MVFGSTHLSDDEFLEAFHTCRLEIAEFRHADHLRLAWIHLHRESFDEALRQVREGVQKFAIKHKVPHLYHETITVAWMRLLATHHEASFEEFIAVNGAWLGKDLLHRFWSPEVLMSDEARRAWLPPDRQNLPEMV